MFTLQNYTIDHSLYDGTHSMVYRATRTADNLPVVIKVLKKEYPLPIELARFRREHEMTKALDGKNIITALSLEYVGNTLAIVLEDFGGEALSNLLRSKIDGLDLAEKIALAIQIVDGIGQIHHANLIHKDINPSNIIWNPDTHRVKLIDFGISTQLPRETPAISSVNTLEGTLAYMSPEQTGRMNRSMDYRTDLYSLGVTLYEFFTGQRPFIATDPMELVHSHIARLPYSPYAINDTVPQPLSDIIIKLMSKMAEDRYRSAFGVKHDLERCLALLKDNASPQSISFQIGEKDISDRLRIPQKLYGREKELTTLLAGFDEVSRGACKLVLVTGQAGIGKTALVHEVQRPMPQESASVSIERLLDDADGDRSLNSVYVLNDSRRYFISGKFDQLKKSVPYAPLIQAFKQLIQQILGESDAQIADWKEKLLKALGPNGQVIIDVIPDVELIIGKQPKVPEVGPMENVNRFNYVFENFITTFASESHPLVIFLDDLQWADSASLKLIEMFITVRAEYLYFIGAYRDSEVDGAHALTMTLDEIKKSGAVVETVELHPLEIFHISQIVAETFSCDAHQSESLATLCFEKTLGNPFFLNQFIHSLYQDNLILFNHETGAWLWDEAKIRATNITDNVVDLMVDKIQRLSPNTRRLISLAACIGNRFDLNILSVVYGKDIKQTAEDLGEALQKELVLPLDDAYKYVSLSPSSLSYSNQTILNSSQSDGGVSIPAYRFLHDRVQQAAYSSIGEDERAKVHLKIGREMLKMTSDDDLEEKIFQIVDQFNFGSKSWFDDNEREKIIRLNLIAGQQAKKSAAFKPAFEYLNLSIGLLKDNYWTTEYDLSKSLFEEAAESAYLCGQFDEMEQHIEEILKHVVTVLDKVKAYEIRINAYSGQHKLLKAVDTGLNALKLLGMNFSQKISTFIILFAYLKTRFLLFGKTIDDLILLPKMSDPYKLAQLQIISSMDTALYFSSPKLSHLIMLRSVILSLLGGHSVASFYSYGAYGIILCGYIGNIELGYLMGKLSLKLSKKYSSSWVKSSAFVIFNLFISHWKRHIRQTLPMLREGFQHGIESGNFGRVAPCLYTEGLHSYCAGIELYKVEKIILANNQVIKKINQHTYLLNNLWQTVLNLMGKNDGNPSLLIGKVYNEDSMIELYSRKKDKTSLCYTYVHKLVLLFLFYDFVQGRKIAVDLKVNLESIFSTILFGIYHCYDSLNELALFHGGNQREKKNILRHIAKNQRKIKKWAHHAPMNYLHKWQLVEAEKYRVLGKHQKAMEYYDLAIKGAHENEYIQEEALGYELAAKFYLENDKTLIAQAYMTEARYRYMKWGAMAKVKHLDDTYPELLKTSRHALNIPSFNPSISSDGTLMSTLSESESESEIVEDASSWQSAEADPSNQWDNTITESSIDENTITETIPPQTSQTSRTTDPVFKTGSISQKLDLDTVMKASQTISGEIQFDKLLSKMLDIVIENAGAQKAILILERDGKWIVEAEADIKKDESAYELSKLPQSSISSTSRPAISLDAIQNDQDAFFPKSMVQYVIHTQEPVILNDVENRGSFSADAYIIRNHPKSMLAIPILHQNRLIGVGYLENNLTEGAFTPDRLALLRMLSSQIAISIENARLYANLEGLVDERTRELSQTLEDLKTTQDQLVESEKMAALGQLIAGIAHEINTPLGVIRSSAGNMLDAFNEAIPKLPELFNRLSVDNLKIFFSLVQEALVERKPLTTREERKLRRKLSNQLEENGIKEAAEIADTLIDMGIHEDIAPFLPLFQEADAPFFVQLAYNLSGQQRNSNSILTAVERASKTVFALKNYAHYDRSGEKVNANLLDGIETVLTLYHNQIKQGVEVVLTGFEELPLIPCYPDELNQVWTNLIHNALQAMAYKGRLTIDARLVAADAQDDHAKNAENQNDDGQADNDEHLGYAIIRFTDTGCGIPEDIQKRIFEPFFTTKAKGEGSGLGLEICRRIVEKHHGSLSVQSRVGETVFTVKLSISSVP